MRKRILMLDVVLMVVLGLSVLMGLSSSVEAVIVVRSAAVVNGVAVVEGGNAPRGAPIFWEGTQVTQANNGGNFAFQGVVPADCVGRLEDGVPADAVDVALANCGPVSEAPAPVPQTGQTQCWDAAGTLIPCAGTGQDGEFQAGVPIPSLRLSDNGDGTVTDNLTGFIWLKDAFCGGGRTWADALALANTLASGNCGLTDGSVPGNWRLPNVKELQSLFDFGEPDPALPEGHPFLNVSSVWRWSSTTWVDSPSAAYVVLVNVGYTRAFSKDTTAAVWPVRGGN